MVDQGNMRLSVVAVALKRFSVAVPRHTLSSYLERRPVPNPITQGPDRRANGFTLIEILMVVAILITLSAIAIPAYSTYRERAKIARAISEIKILSQEITGYTASNEGTLPVNLDNIGRGSLLDPWGNPYEYLNYATVHGVGPIRKDRNLHPLNSDYDLYSKGKDGRSQPQITTPFSQDDIIRANDGRFIGLAANY